MSTPLLARVAVRWEQGTADYGAAVIGVRTAGVMWSSYGYFTAATAQQHACAWCDRNGWIIVSVEVTAKPIDTV